MKLEVVNEGAGYALSGAVLIYTNRDAGHAFATKHEVVELDLRPSIRPGTPFTEEDYRTLVSAMAPKEQPKMQWHNPRVLAKGLGRVVWWTPPQMRSMFFKTSTHIAGTFDAKGVAPNPGLVWMGTQQALYLWAFKGSDAPTPETRLYQAPFFNVWARGQVCIGNAVMPPEDQRDDLDAWERTFFGSRFTHPNFSQADRLTVGVNPIQFWKDQLAKPSRAFPEHVLFELNLNVQDLLDVNLERVRAIGSAQGEF